jgi:glycosyltransferase involved in cell wall biosynthesis
MKKILEKKQSVSVIVPMKNSETTILLTLKSISEQEYPVKEIIVIDNVSTDNSIICVEDYAKKSKIPVKLLKRTENKGVGASYNLGAKTAKSDLLIFMHSDSTLASKNELTKLITPLIDDQKTVASYSTIINPESVWETYNFWQKCLFARAVDQENPGLNGKFDCLRRDVYLRIGGYDDVRFGENIGIGSEDADLHLRLKNEGKVILSKARVIHLHYLGNNYKLSDWLNNRKLLARSYGSIIRIQGTNLPVGAFAFAIKPILSVLPFVPHLHITGLIILFIYAFWYTKKMFMSASTLRDPRILLLPGLNIFFIYYETFWMIISYLSIRKKII